LLNVPVCIQNVQQTDYYTFILLSHAVTSEQRKPSKSKIDVIREIIWCKLKTFSSIYFSFCGWEIDPLTFFGVLDSVQEAGSFL
jgi:hypothetical protein